MYKNKAKPKVLEKKILILFIFTYFRINNYQINRIMFYWLNIVI